MLYRFGFNGQEKSDEISGTGNHNTAQFWEYDTRLGRRWNLDPVKKSWQSDYACFSNSPIWKIDPDGDDDFFNSDGSYSHSTKSGTRIRIISGKTTVQFSELPTNSMHNRQVLANITAYYAGLVGITGTVGLANHNEKESNGKDGVIAFTTANKIYVNAKGGGVNPLLNDFNNFKNVLVHENDHKDKGQGYKGATDFEHAEVYLNQMQDKTFENTTSDFKRGMVGSVSNYLSDVAQSIGGAGGSGDFSDLNNLIGEFNKLSGKTGYTFSLIQTASGMGNSELNKYEVKVSPVKKKK